MLALAQDIRQLAECWADYYDTLTTANKMIKAEKVTKDKKVADAMQNVSNAFGSII